MPDKCILVVDGDELVRWALEREFTAHRMSVRAFSDCAKARERLADGPCDLALVDVAPPEDNRLRLIEEIHARHPGAAIMAMGCDPTPDRKRRAYACGCAQFVDKPFDLGEILNLARSAIGEFPRRRRFPRWHCRLLLRMSVVEPSPEEAGLDLENLGATTIDVAERGLRLRTAYPLQPAQRVRVSATEGAYCVATALPEGEMTVVWTADGKEGVVAGLCKRISVRDTS